MKRHARLVLCLAVALLVVLATDLPRVSAPDQPATIPGAYRSLLVSSTDLGPSQHGDAQITVTLPAPTRPDALFRWADPLGLSVRWRPDDAWAIVEGAAQDLAKGFGVPVHDYRGRKGQVFYASSQQPSVPVPLRDVVTGVGRVLGYSPHHLARPWIFPLDVPRQGLTPQTLLTAYNATPLAQEGFTGKGATIVFFEFDGYDQADLDGYAQMTGLPKFTPVLIGGQPGPAHGETVMDLEVAHAIAPDARLVVVNTLPTVTGDGAYEKIGQLFESVDRQFPGAVWSLSIGWGCEALQRGRPRSRPVCPGQCPHTWHGRLRRQWRHGRSGVQRRRGLVDPAGPERYRPGRRRRRCRRSRRSEGPRCRPTRRGGGFRRRPGPMCRCPRAPAGASQRCSPAPAFQRRYRHDSRFCAPPGSRYRRRRRPVHGGADRVRTAAENRRRYLSGRADLGRADGIDEPVPAGARRQAGRATSTRCSTGSRRERSCPDSAMCALAVTPSTSPLPGTTW